MGRIGKFGDFVFEIGESALLFEGLKLSGDAETEDQEGDGQKYVSRKNGKPVEVSLTAILEASLGCDVEGTALAMVAAAQKGETHHLYLGEKRLFDFSLMLTKAATEEIQLSPGGKWVRTKVALTLKQAGMPEVESSGDSGDSGGDGGGGSVADVTQTITKAKRKHPPLIKRERINGVTTDWGRDSITKLRNNLKG